MMSIGNSEGPNMHTTNDDHRRTHFPAYLKDREALSPRGGYLFRYSATSAGKIKQRVIRSSSSASIHADGIKLPDLSSSIRSWPPSDENNPFNYHTPSRTTRVTHIYARRMMQVYTKHIIHTDKRAGSANAAVSAPCSKHEHGLPSRRRRPGRELFLADEDPIVHDPP